MARFPSLALLGLVVLLAISGCTSRNDSDKLGPSNPEPSEGSSFSQTQSTSENSTPIDPATSARQIILSGCFGWSIFRGYPGSLANPGAPPPGWDEAPSDEIFSGVDIQAYRCDRVSLGHFERGPIHVLLEAHNNADFPAECRAGFPGTGGFSVLSSIWIDDPEVGAYLSQSYQAPVQIFEVEEATEDLGPSTLHQWSWKLAVGSAVSSVTVVDDEQTAQDAPLFDRYFWPQGTGLVQLDWAPDDDGPTGNRFANGTFQPPHLLASDSSGVFAGLGEWYPRREAVGDFTFFADMNCEQPIP